MASKYSERISRLTKADLKNAKGIAEASKTSDLWLKKLNNTVKVAKSETISGNYHEVVQEMERLANSQVNRVQEAVARYHYLFDKVKRMNNSPEKTELKNEMIDLQGSMNDQPFINEVIISYPEIFKSTYGLV